MTRRPTPCSAGDRGHRCPDRGGGRGCLPIRSLIRCVPRTGSRHRPRRTRHKARPVRGTLQRRPPRPSELGPVHRATNRSLGHRSSRRCRGPVHELCRDPSSPDRWDATGQFGQASRRSHPHLLTTTPTSSDPMLRYPSTRGTHFGLDSGDVRRRRPSLHGSDRAHAESCHSGSPTSYTGGPNAPGGLSCPGPCTDRFLCPILS